MKILILKITVKEMTQIYNQQQRKKERVRGYLKQEGLNPPGGIKKMPRSVQNKHALCSLCSLPALTSPLPEPH